MYDFVERAIATEKMGEYRTIGTTIGETMGKEEELLERWRELKLIDKKGLLLEQFVKQMR